MDQSRKSGPFDLLHPPSLKTNRRTYEEMMLWSSDERERWLDEQSRSRDGLRFTDNVVILHVNVSHSKRQR